jgi:putative intracellular protease/amidase
MGGVTVVPDLALDELSPADSAMLIVPGGGGWEAGGHTGFPLKAGEFLDAGAPVAAICGAVFGFAAAGLLDDRDHTGAAAEYLAMSGYRGGARYRDADAVRDRGLITAGPTDSVAFAREVIAELGIWQPAVLDAWFRLFSRSEAAAFGELMSLVSTA